MASDVRRTGRGRRRRGYDTRATGQVDFGDLPAEAANAFIAVILDRIDDRAKAVYRHFDFADIPGHAYHHFPTAPHRNSKR